MSGLIIFPPKIEDDIELNSNFEMKLFCFFVDLRCSAMLVTVVALGELVSNGFILFKTEVALALNESCMLEMLEEKVVTSVVSDCSEDDEDTFEKALIKLGLSLSIGFFLSQKIILNEF